MFHSQEMSEAVAEARDEVCEKIKKRVKDR